MTERIDHVAATQSLLQHAQGADPVAARVTLDAAQVHATLALVEQQRIANLIATGSNPASAFGPRIYAEIREGLGL